MTRKKDYENLNIGILERSGFSDRAISELSQVGSVFLYENEDLGDFLKNKEILFVRLGHRIDKAFLEQAPKLRYLCSPTTGHNHLDLENLKERKIELLSLKGEQRFLRNVRATPEHSFGLILALLRNYTGAFLHSHNQHWDRDACRGEDLYAKRVGFLGLGRVGKRVAEYCLAFGAQVSFYDPDQKLKHSKKIKRLATELELVKDSQIVLLCASYSKENEAMVGPELLCALKDRYFINTARGELVDQECLLKGLKEKWFKGVALDVLRKEQQDDFKIDPWLAYCDNGTLVLTPHIAGASTEAMHQTEEFLVKKLIKTLGLQ